MSSVTIRLSIALEHPPRSKLRRGDELVRFEVPCDRASASGAASHQLCDTHTHVKFLTPATSELASASNVREMETTYQHLEAAYSSLKRNWRVLHSRRDSEWRHVQHG